MTAYDEARARFVAAVDRRDRLEAELALSDMKHAVEDEQVAAFSRRVAWWEAGQGARWWWESEA